MAETLKCPNCLDETLIRKIGYAVCAGCDFVQITPVEPDPDTPASEAFVA